MTALLMAVKPTDRSDYQEMERLYDVGRCTNKLSVILLNYNIVRIVRIFAPYGTINHEPEHSYIVQLILSLHV